MKTALTIAGSDPSGGAGLQRDLETFRGLGVRGLSVAAALTAQNSSAVRAILPVPPRFVSSQLRALLEEFRIDAVKVGMTGTPGNLKAVGRLIKAYGMRNVVLDTVLRSTGGKALLAGGGVRELRSLLPLVEVVTPNLPEAAALTGIRGITTCKHMEEAARRLHEMGAPHVLIKGGHLEGEPVDVLYNGRSFRRFKGKRVSGGVEKFHGTGCVLSAGIAAGLAKGMGVERAVGEARAYLIDALRGRRRA